MKIERVWARSSRSLLTCTVLAAVGCGDDAPSSYVGADAGAPPLDASRAGDADAAPALAGDAGVHDDYKAGEFSLQLVAPVAASASTTATDGFTALLGKVFSGPTPESTVWDEVEASAGCKLLKPRVPFCDPGCGSGSVCVDDNRCQASPTAISVGKVTLRGVRTSEGSDGFTADPIKNTYQTPASIKLPYPAFLEGAAISLSAAGADVAAFSISGRGIAPLALGGEGGFPIKTGTPLTLSWAVPASAENSRVRVKMDISHHGGSKGKIECDVADSGALSIAASLVDKLVALGVAGFPTIVVTREAVASAATTAGRVDLRTYSYVERAIEIDGLVSCSSADDCPTGHSCRDDLTCD
jgi:hypothetical protein